MRFVISALFVVSLAATTLFGQQRSGGASSDSYRDQFGVISERNMFVKDRVRGRGEGASTQPSTRPTEAPLTPEESYVLRGVVFENDLFTAYFENLATSRIEAVNVGAELAQMRIADVALDAVELEKNGQTQWIAIGRDLRGDPARQTKLSGATTAPAGPATATDPATLSVEERLRQRRLQERGGR